MTDPQAFKAQLDQLAAYPNTLRQQVRGLSDEAVRFRPAAGEWSIVEIIGHMVDVDILMQGRIGQMISRDNPTLQVLDFDENVRQRDYQSKQANFLVNTFAERREAIVEELRYLQPARLARTGQHPTRGPLTIGELIATLVRHGPTHTEQIAANIDAFSKR